MKLRTLMSACLVGFSMTLFAQTHKEGVEYYKADQFGNARELLNRNFNNPGTDQALADYYLGQIEVIVGDLQKARNYFNDGLQKDPNCAYNYVGLGMIELKQGNVKAAQKYFKDAESKAKKDATVLVDIARAYYDVDPVAYAKEIDKKIEQAQKKDISNPDIYILLGDMEKTNALVTKDQKLYGKAAAQYEMATHYDPTSAAGYVKYAKMFSDLHNYNYAITKLQELLNNSPESALGQRELANAFYDNQNYDKAVEAYNRYISNPNHFQKDEDRYAYLLFYDQKYPEGYEFATKLLNRDPNNFTAQRFQFMNAIYMPELASQLPDLASSLWSNHNAKQDENLFSYLDYKLIANEMIRENKTQDAIDVLEEAAVKFPDYAADYKKNIPSLYIDLGDYGKGADAYVDYLSTQANPTSGDYNTVGAYAIFAGIQRQEGVTPDENNTPFPKDEEGAKVYFNLGKEYLQKALELDPDNQKIKDMIDVINSYLNK